MIGVGFAVVLVICYMLGRQDGRAIATADAEKAAYRRGHDEGFQAGRKDLMARVPGVAQELVAQALAEADEEEARVWN